MEELPLPTIKITPTIRKNLIKWLAEYPRNNVVVRALLLSEHQCCVSDQTLSDYRRKHAEEIQQQREKKHRPKAA